MRANEGFYFICTAGQAANMVKVIKCRNGQIIEKRGETDGVVFTVLKKPDDSND